MSQTPESLNDLTQYVMQYMNQIKSLKNKF